MNDLLYQGAPGAYRVTAAEPDFAIRDLDPRHDLFNHSPDGFSWGYHGTGPAQLALALCADALGDDQRALRVYQSFKRAAVGTWPEGESWEITRAEVIALVEKIEAEAS